MTRTGSESTPPSWGWRSQLQAFSVTVKLGWSVPQRSRARYSVPLLVVARPPGVTSRGKPTSTGGKAGAAPPAATIFGALSSLLGFGPAVRDGLRREAKVHQEPAFVFWKLGVPGAA
ncbi:hypothetical protein [Amycolatopsis sp. NPDC051128]|uniref:hypothetical protein n=1 Tax=Amycolatopsis sp. NPDC051128 TaxID=3155412 RepID=UPI003434BA97